MTSKDPYAFEDEEGSEAVPRGGASKKGRKKGERVTEESAGGGGSGSGSRHGGGGRVGASTASVASVASKHIVPLSAAKPLSTNELVARLKDLHSQLSALEQETVDLATVQATASHLVQPSLLGHRDKGVRSLVACSLADVLRLFAPDAPYNQTQLKSIFSLFVNQLPHIADTDGPYFENYYYLLESLAVVKSIILLTDLNADELIVSLFRDIFSFVRADFQKNVYAFLLQILSCLVDESATLSNEIIEIIIAQFDKPNNNMCRQLAIDVCNASTDKLQRYICQHFGDLFYQSMKLMRGSGVYAAVEDDDEEELEEEGGRGNSHAEFKHAHRLILEMNKHCMGVLQNVIPLFEDQLRCEDEKVRELSINVLGKIFMDSGSRVAVQYPAIWKVWCDRRNDKSSPIRILWVQFATDAFRHHPELCADIVAGMEQKFYDPDEKVRVTAMKVVGQLESVSLTNVPRDMLLHVADRCKDKKMSVRAEAIQSLSNVFKITYADIVADESQAAEKYGWIPGCILELAYLDDLETRIIMERVLHEDIFVYSYDDVQRTDRLLRIVGALTDKQYKAFLNVIDRQAVSMKDFMMFIELCEKWNGGIVDNDDGVVESSLNQIIIHLASRFPDQKKAASHFQKFAKHNENRIYKLFRALMNESADFKTIAKNGKEIIKRLELHSGLTETFVVILRRVSLAIVGKSSIPRLIEVAQSSSARHSKSTEISMMETTVDMDLSRLAATAEGLIKRIAAVFPGVYGSHLKQFLHLLTSDDRSLVSESLEALSKFIKAMPKDVVLSKPEQDVIVGLALRGSMVQAKQAGTILALLSDSRPRSAVINKIGGALKLPSLVLNAIRTSSNRSIHEEADDDDMELDVMPPAKLATWFATLAQFALYAKDEYAVIQEGVSSLVLKEILLKTHIEKDPHNDEDWIEFEYLHIEGVMKVLGLKLLVNRVRGCANAAAETVQLMARPLFKIIGTLLDNEGEMVPQTKGVTCNAFKSHLRLTASISMLKLLRIEACEKMITVPERNRLMLTIQDPNWQIRDAFVDRLRKYLQAKNIAFKYIVVLCMAALEPDDDIRIKAKTFLSRFAKASKSDDGVNLEPGLVGVIHMVAHHPDFGTENEDINLSAKYIQFFLDIVATSENAAFLFHSVAQLKTVVDVHAETSDALYHVCDLSQFLIQEHCKQHLWTLDTFPDVIPINRELFKKLPQQAANENVKRSYLSKNWMQSTQSANSQKSKVSAPKRRSLTKAEKDRSIENDDEDMADFDDDDEEAGAANKSAAGSKKKRKATAAKVNRASKTGDGARKKKKSEPVSAFVEPRSVSHRGAKGGLKKYKEASNQEDEDDSMNDETTQADQYKSEGEEEFPLRRPARKAASGSAATPKESPVKHLSVVPSNSDSAGSQDSPKQRKSPRKK
ncbi:armadillo-type protein [Chytriomyces sp. MP71]|nr:armadillo-type protein [Chytriomyces sp. MP71]